MFWLCYLVSHTIPFFGCDTTVSGLGRGCNLIWKIYLDAFKVNNHLAWNAYDMVNVTIRGDGLEDCDVTFLPSIRDR
jgi:hypothetical protein